MNKDRKEAKPKERGKAWRGRKRKEVKPLEEQRFKPGGPIAQECPKDCPYITPKGRCRLRKAPISQWQGRKRCRLYEWWEREKWEVLAKKGKWYGRM